MELFIDDSLDLSTAYLRINTDTAFRKTIYLLVRTEVGIFNYVELTIIVCGNEILLPI